MKPKISSCQLETLVALSNTFAEKIKDDVTTKDYFEN